MGWLWRPVGRARPLQQRAAPVPACACLTGPERVMTWVEAVCVRLEGGVMCACVHGPAVTGGCDTGVGRGGCTRFVAARARAPLPQPYPHPSHCTSPQLMPHLSSLAHPSAPPHLSHRSSCSLHCPAPPRRPTSTTADARDAAGAARGRPHVDGAGWGGGAEPAVVPGGAPAPLHDAGAARLGG